MIILILIGFFSGIISGMGIGGGALLIPALTFFSDMTQQQLQNINLIYFIPTASIALCTHVKNKSIEKKALKTIVLFGLAGAAIGALIAVNTKPELMKKLFGGFLFIMGVIEFLKNDEKNL